MWDISHNFSNLIKQTNKKEFKNKWKSLTNRTKMDKVESLLQNTKIFKKQKSYSRKTAFFQKF